MRESVIWNDTADAIAVHEANIAPEFFDLSTGIAGEVQFQTQKDFVFEERIRIYQPPLIASCAVRSPALWTYPSA